MGQQVGSEPDLLLEVNDFTLIFSSFLEMIWLTVGEKQIPLFVNTKSISWLAELSPTLTVFLLGEQGLPSPARWQDKHREARGGAQTVNLPLWAQCMFVKPAALPSNKFTSTLSFSVMKKQPIGWVIPETVSEK